MVTKAQSSDWKILAHILGTCFHTYSIQYYIYQELNLYNLESVLLTLLYHQLLLLLLLPIIIVVYFILIVYHSFYCIYIYFCHTLLFHHFFSLTYMGMHYLIWIWAQLLITANWSILNLDINVKTKRRHRNFILKVYIMGCKTTTTVLDVASFYGSANIFQSLVGVTAAFLWLTHYNKTWVGGFCPSENLAVFRKVSIFLFGGPHPFLTTTSTGLPSSNNGQKKNPLRFPPLFN